MFNDTIPTMADKGRPAIEGLKDFLVSLSVEDQAWFKEHLKGKLQPDGNKDNLSAWLRRAMAEYRQQTEAMEALAEKRAQKDAK